MKENRQREVTIIDSYPALAQEGAVMARYCAMVSRDPAAPRSRRALHGKGRQFLELRSEICGTVTTVQKDTLVWIEYDAPAAQVKSEKWREGCDGIATNGTKK